jgi:hypothetical protein
MTQPLTSRKSPFGDSAAPNAATSGVKEGSEAYKGVAANDVLWYFLKRIPPPVKWQFESFFPVSVPGLTADRSAI